MNSDFQTSNLTANGYVGETIDNVIADHFEKLYVFFDTFLEDPKLSLLHTESAFRSRLFQTTPTVYSAYHWAADRILSESELEADCAGSPVGMLCFMLREVGQFSYMEIAQMTDLDRQDVGAHIAAMRSRLMGDHN